MNDGDVLLGEIIVRSGRMTRDAVDRALAETSLHRRPGEAGALARYVVERGLIDRDSLERLEREARALEGTHVPDPASRPPRPSARQTAVEGAPREARRAPTGRLEARPPEDVGFRTAVIPAVPGAVPPRKSQRLEPSLIASAATPPALVPLPAPAPPPPSTPASVPAGLGRTWGRYEILSEVARGAMGAVYRAYDTRRRQEVALKVLLQGSQAEGEDIERFKREARSLARLAHPSIVRVHDYGVEAGCPFITMDFVAGTTLESIIKGGGLPLERGLVILEEVARAIDHAHSRGVVHRDLKPANVLIGADGRARITDFGLAKILDEGQRLTRAGDLIGTPLYMSPEQIRGDLAALGPSSDVWSLGVGLYLLLTAQQPFGAKTIEEVARRVLHDEPLPPEKLKPGIAPDLSRICLTALEKDPKRRYQSAGELASDLRHYLHGKPVLAGRVTFGMRLRRLARAARLRLGSGTNLVVLLGLSLATAATLGVALTLGSHRGEVAGTPSEPFHRLQALVNEIETGKLAGTPEAASAELNRAYVDLAAVTSGDVDFLARGGNLRARGHRRLAEIPPPASPAAAPRAADEWAARQFALASETSSGPETRDVLAHLLAAVARTRNLELRRDAHRRVHALAGMSDPGLLALDGRAAALAGDWAQARETLEPLLRASPPPLPPAEREPALLAYFEALIANDELEAVADRAAKEEALAGNDASAPARVARLRLVEARVGRARAALEGQPSGWQKVLEDARGRIQLLKGEPAASPIRQALATEEALAHLDAGAPAAALECLRAVPASDEEPETVVARARARVLGEEPAWGAPSQAALVALALAPDVLPETRADAAQAAVELAIETGSPDALLDALERGAAASGPVPRRLAARLAFLRAAPAVLRALERLSGEWAHGAPAVRGEDGVAALASIAGASREKDRDPRRAPREARKARAWLLVLERADVATGFVADDLLRAVSVEGTSLAAALEVHALDAATASVPVSGRAHDWLAGKIWPNGQASPEVQHRYDLASAQRSDDPRGGTALLGREALDPGAEGIRRLLGIVADRIAEAQAWLPPSLADREAPRFPDGLGSRLDAAERLLAVALLRDPLSARVHRARAELALVRAQLLAVSTTEIDRVREHARTALSEAAAAALLDPFDRADLLALARATRATGDVEASRRWAGRVRTATRGELSEADAALVEALASRGGPDRHAPSAEEIARLALVAGQTDDARALDAVSVQLDREAEARLAELELERSPDGKAPARHGPFPFSPVSPLLRRRLADLHPPRGDAFAWAELALWWDPAIDQGLRDLPPLGQDKEGEPDPDPARSLARAVLLVRRIEGERDARAAEQILARLAPLATDVIARRPDAVAGRALLDYALALAGSHAEVAEAVSDLTRLGEIEAARSQARAWDGGPGSALPAAALALARAVLDPGKKIATDEHAASELLERAEVAPARDRLKVGFKR